MIRNFSIEKNVPLGPLTTLGVGGEADHFLSATSEEAILFGFDFARENNLDVFVLGGGSNVLISDEGFRGLVIKVDLLGRAFDRLDENTFNLICAAGESWDDVVEEAIRRDLQGIECLSGIPGSVGGTPVQNVGAYGQEVSETIHSVRCLDRSTGKIVDLSNGQCGFSYRKSIFNTTAKEKFVVLSVNFRLNIAGKPKIVYADLQKHFDERIPTLRETRDAVLAIRAAKSMVIDLNDPNSRSAGSFFKNPIVTLEFLNQLDVELRKSGRLKFEEVVPSFRVDDSHAKIAAAWLIERAGFHKGFRKGNAGISANHSLALINCGNAGAAEIVALKEEIQESVNREFGISLEPEPIFVGF